MVHDAAAWVREHKLYVLFAAIALVGALFWVFTGDINPSTDDAQVDGNAIVISPRVSGYVEKMLIDDNTVVKQGDLMIQLDPADYQARVDHARAALQVAEARAASLKIAVPFTEGTTSSATLAASAQLEAERSELASAAADYERLSTSELRFAQANIDARKAQLDKADADVKRTRTLADDSEISRQQFDAYVAADEVARNEWLAAQERLNSTKREAEAAKAAQDTAKSRVAQGQAEVKREQGAGVAVWREKSRLPVRPRRCRPGKGNAKPSLARSWLHTGSSPRQRSCHQAHRGAWTAVRGRTGDVYPRSAGPGMGDSQPEGNADGACSSRPEGQD